MGKRSRDFLKEGDVLIYQDDSGDYIFALVLRFDRKDDIVLLDRGVDTMTLRFDELEKRKYAKARVRELIAKLNEDVIPVPKMTGVGGM